MMRENPSPEPISRREFARATSALTASALVGRLTGSPSAAGAPAPEPKPEVQPIRAAFPPLLTPAEDFEDVSRGDPRPFTLKGDAPTEVAPTCSGYKAS